MTQHQLQHDSPSVVHKSARRTRLRVPKRYRSHDSLHPVKQAITDVPGVKEVEVNPSTGSILVHHDERPGIIGAIGAAIAECAPDLLVSLVVPETIPEAGADLLIKTFKRILGQNDALRENCDAAPEPQQEVDYTRAVSKVKKTIPLIFVGAGVLRLIETQSLWSGMPALALFYYAFDSYWKFDQQARVQQVERETSELARPTSAAGNGSANA